MSLIASTACSSCLPSPTCLAFQLQHTCHRSSITPKLVTYQTDNVRSIHLRASIQLRTLAKNNHQILKKRMKRRRKQMKVVSKEMSIAVQEKKKQDAPPLVRKPSSMFRQTSRGGCKNLGCSRQSLLSSRPHGDIEWLAPPREWLEIGEHGRAAAHDQHAQNCGPSLDLLCC